MEFKEITFGLADYQHSLVLRDQLLRRPLGKVLSESDTHDDVNQRHFGIFIQDELQACVVIKPLPHNQATLRQMAVASHLQGQGLGQHLIIQTQIALKKDGCQHIELSARETAQVFYEKLGYQTKDQAYLEHDISHIKMTQSF
jgi:predicted GNAT family N-acyltransferase